MKSSDKIIKEVELENQVIGQGLYGGGVFVVAGAITKVLLRMQQHLGIRGDIAEIGVLEGAYSMQLIPFLNEFEICFAIDPYFAEPQLKQETQVRLESVCKSPSDLLFMNESSLDIRAQNLIRENSPGIRFFSIDGDHTEKFVLNDLLLARDTLVDGGIVALDDYFDQNSPGVSVAMTKYFMEMNEGRLAILAAGGNKVFLTTAAEYPIYRMLLEKFSTVKQSMSHPEVEWHNWSVLIIDKVLHDFLPQ